MLRALFALGTAFLSALTFASAVYIQKDANGRVTFGDAVSMPSNAKLHMVKPATAANTQASAPNPAPNEALTVLNNMEQRNLKNITESREKIARLYKQAAEEKSPNIRANLLSQIQAETQATEIYNANLNQIKKNKEALKSPS
ncbi:DUF4124 domain-containing protein [Iodobacter arcticus]|uniref:DUF4124 domain-containing protein n=1 Tax=Iodobacter arcticus TaxID=590593 RepID=A0ABW2QVD9_9NEIS